MDKIINTIAEELNIKPNQVESTVKLIDEGKTIPFIARYRKEVTGGLSDEVLRTFGERLNYLRNLEKRKEEVTTAARTPPRCSVSCGVYFMKRKQTGYISYNPIPWGI